MQNHFLVQGLRETGWDVEVLTIRGEDAEREVGMVDTSILSPHEEGKVHRAAYVSFRSAVLRFRDRVRTSMLQKGIVGTSEKASHAMRVSAGTFPTHSHLRSLKDMFTDELLSFPDRDCGWISRGYRLGRKIVREKGCRMLFATSPPHSTLVLGNLLKYKFGIPLVSDLHDPWVGNPYRESRSATFNRLSERLHAHILGESDHVRANTEALKDHIVTLLPSCIKKISVGTCGFPEFIGVCDGLLERGSGNIFTIIHAGSLYGNRSPRKFLLALRRLAENGTFPSGGVRVRFFGPVTVPDREFRDLLSDGFLASMMEMGSLPRETCLREMCSANLLVTFQQGTRLQVPAKIFEYLSIGRPMLTIADEGGATWEMIKSEGFGECITDDEDAIAEALTRAYAHRKKQSGQRQYPNAEKYSFREIAARLDVILTGLIGGRQV